MRYTTLVLLSLLLALSASGDSCQWQDDPPYNYVFVCYPTYGVAMYSQPDYSLYAVGTIFWLHKTSGVEDIWYATDIPGPAPSCCSVGPYILQNTGGLVPQSICNAQHALFADWSEVNRTRCFDTSSGNQSTWTMTSCNRTVYCPNQNNCQARNSSTLPCP